MRKCKNMGLHRVDQPHSFLIVRPRRTLRFYIMWTLQFALAPIVCLTRFVLYFIVCNIADVTMRCVSVGADMDIPLNPFRRRLIMYATQGLTKALLFFMGITVCEVNTQYKPHIETAHTLVMNHINSMDGMLFYALGYTGFIARVETKRMPYFGLFSTVNQAIFVDRQSATSKRDTIRQIQERSNDIFDRGLPRKFPPLCVCPEGTTNNGTTMMPFMKGAFIPGRPVCPVLVKYDNSLMDNSDGARRMYKVALQRLLLLFNVKVSITYHPVYVPNAEEQLNPQLYAENVREYMARLAGAPLCDMTFRDKRYYAGWSKDYDLCSDTFKKFGPECTKDNGYYTVERPNKAKTL